MEDFFIEILVVRVYRLRGYILSKLNFREIEDIDISIIKFNSIRKFFCNL